MTWISPTGHSDTELMFLVIGIINKKGDRL